MTDKTVKFEIMYEGNKLSIDTLLKAITAINGVRTVKTPYNPYALPIADFLADLLIGFGDVKSTTDKLSERLNGLVTRIEKMEKDLRKEVNENEKGSRKMAVFKF